MYKINFSNATMKRFVVHNVFLWSNQVSVSGLTLLVQGMQRASGSVEHLTLLSRPNRIIFDNPLDPFTHKHARKFLRNTVATNFWELVKRVPDIIQRDQMPPRYPRDWGASAKSDAGFDSNRRPIEYMYVCLLMRVLMWRTIFLLASHSLAPTLSTATSPKFQHK